MSEGLGEYQQACSGCDESLGEEGASSWVGCGELHPLCLPCCRAYGAMRAHYPDHSPVDIIGLLRITRLYDRLPRHLKPKLCRMLILLRNGNRRAQRLVRTANRHELSMLQLLELI